jgi:16S rRNA (cytidine1402-2'-O)-methyltransferase
MPGTLYLVATPIGNLEDITLRALRVLKEADVIAAEDTRVTRKLLSHYSIGAPLISYHEHSGPEATAALVHRMTEGGQSVALVTDAGTPAISDPGAELVRAAIDAGILVSPIPGPAAPVCALIASGLPPARFLFEGFPPRTRSTRIARLAALARESRTLIFFESPRRLGATLDEMAHAFGAGRPACVAREISKIFEEFRRGGLAELASEYSANTPRGECCIVVGGWTGGEPEAPTAEPEDAPGWKDQIKRLAKEAGIDRKDLYQAIVKHKAQARDGRIA